MYSDEVQRIRNEAHKTNVANKIMDMLQKLEENSTEDSQRRWIWELIQNAKDVANGSGEVNIKIDYNKDARTFGSLTTSFNKIKGFRPILHMM